MEEKLTRKKKILEDIESAENIMAFVNKSYLVPPKFCLTVEIWPKDKTLYVKKSVMKKVLKNTLQELYTELNELE